MEEIWKDIPNYEGIYQASTFGNIRTVEGKTTYSVRHGERHWKSRILKGRGDNHITGKRVSLWKDKKCKDWLVARLVAITFLGEPKEKLTVNHIDGNRLNNRIENLEWLTLGDNIRHGFNTGLYPQKQVTLFKNGKKFKTFRSMAECSRFLGKNTAYVSNVLKRKGKILESNDGETYNYKAKAISHKFKP